MFQPNAVIAGRYQVVRLVGQGGMSNLYLAYDRKYSNASVVVKEMTASYSDPKEQQMAVDLFHREAKLLASLNHRHIPKVYDYFQFAGKYYLSMEYIDGVDLAVKLEQQNGPLPEKQVLQWGGEIATVLFYLHKHEPPIVFRDVKPSNIMISSQGVKLIDFGIARHFDQAKKGDTMRIGSPGYAPPEQYAAQTDPRSDIYALGVTLHHALTGRDPTATNTPFLVPPARDLNPALAEATSAMLARATQLDPSDRYQSALEMKKDIKHILNQNSQSTRVVGAPPALPTDKQNQTPDASNAKGEAQKSSTPSPASAGQQPAAQSSTSAQGTPSGQAQQPSQKLQAPANQSGTGSGPLNSASQAQPTPAKKAKKKLGFGRLLLAACLFALVGLGGYIANLSPESRNTFLQKIKVRVQAWMGELNFQPDGDDLLREALLKGTPEALLPFFQSSEFKELSKEKQELFRLNLLAAGSNDGPLKMLHILLPEGQADSEILKTATRVVKTANSSGGVNRELLVIVPATYKPGALELTLRKLAKTKQENVTPSYLIIGGQEEQFSEKIPDNALFLTTKEIEDRAHLSSLESPSINLEEVFQFQLNSDSPPTVWAVEGETPTQAIKAEPTPTEFDTATLDKLLTQAREAGGRVALRADNAKNLAKTSEKGEVLLFSVTPKNLPQLPPGLEGKALVLSSPFEPDLFPDSIHFQPKGHQEEFDLGEARLFDALILTPLKKDSSFEGMTVIRNPSGEYSPKKPILYKWNGAHWLPVLTGEKKTP